MKKRSKKIAAGFRLSDKCLESIKLMAEDNGISQSAIIELAVRDALRKHERK